MVLCAAPGCSNRSDRVDPERRVSFHKFPKDPKILKEWMKNIRRVFKLTQHTRLCSKHFEEWCWEGMNKRKLREEAVPTLFSFDENVLKRSRKVGLDCLRKYSSIKVGQRLPLRSVAA